MSSDGDAANEVLLQIFEDTVEETDLELDLEMMSFLVQGGDRELFYGLLQRVVRLAEVEGDFQDVLCICADFFSCLDQEAQEVAIQEIITRREHLADDEKLDKRDPDIQALLTIFEEARSSQLI